MPDMEAMTTPEITVRMATSLRRDLETYSEREGVSPDVFVTIAVAEKLAHLRHEEWVRTRRPVTPESRARALEILDRMGSDEVEPGDEIPEGYVRR